MSGFLFLRPWWLLALPLVPSMLYLLWRRGNGRAETPWRKVVDPELLDFLLQGTGGRQQAWRRMLWWGVCWCLIILILAGPSWQRLPPLRFQPQAAPLALLAQLGDDLDESALGRIRLALDRLLSRMPARPVSLWVFSDRAWRVMPASEDFRLLRRLVNVLSPELLPSAGNDLARALQRVADAQQGGRVLVVAVHADPSVRPVARRLAETGFRIDVLDPGSRDPELQRLAEAGKGNVYTLATLEKLATALVPPQRRLSADGGRPQPVDNGPWLLPLLLAMLLFRFRPGVAALAAVFLLPLPRAEAGWENLFLNPDQQALRALQRQQPERAARLFRDPLWQGIAYYRAGDYRAAARLFQQLKTPLARYDLGNALVHLGDLEGARAAYRQALAMDPGLTDARHNLALVEKALAQPAQTPDRKIPPKPGKPQGGGRPVPPKPPGSNLDSRAGRGRDAQRKETKRSSQGGAPVPGEEAKRNVEADHHKTASEPAARGEPDAGRPAAEKRGAQRQQTAHRPPTAAPPRTAGDVQRKTEGHPNKRIETTTETARPKGDKGSKPRAKEAGRAGPRSSSTSQPPSPSPRPSLDRRNVDTLEIWLDAIHDDPAELLRALFRQQARGGTR